MNKKGQYYEKPSYSGLSPVLVVGIAVFAVPFIAPVFGWNVNTFISNGLYAFGVILILIGGALSIFNASN